MDFHLPELGEGVYEAEVVRWLVEPGARVKPAQPLLEVLTDKATMEVPAPFHGTVQTLHLEPGQPVKVGQVILTYTQGTEAPILQPAAAKQEPAPPPRPAAPIGNGSPAPTSEHVQASPSVRLLARKLGIDLGTIAGSGPHGRILVEDLQRHLPSSIPQSPRPAEPTMDLGQPGTRIKIQGLRRKISEQMVLSKKIIPHYSYVDECDVTDLVKLRESLKETAIRKGVKITFLAFFVKATAGALKDVPVVNASVEDANGEMVLHDQYNIGVAVATPGGLIVPVLHHADRLGVFEIARKIEELSQQARLGKSRLEDLRGGTFTITSIGNLGGLFATPIILHPQVGILGVGKIVKRPVFDQHDQVRPAHMVYLSFSFDHRVLDGAVGTAFGNALMRRLSNPAALLVE